MNDLVDNLPFAHAMDRVEVAFALLLCTQYLKHENPVCLLSVSPVATELDREGPVLILVLHMTYSKDESDPVGETSMWRQMKL